MQEIEHPKDNFAEQWLIFGIQSKLNKGLFNNNPKVVLSLAQKAKGAHLRVTSFRARLFYIVEQSRRYPKSANAVANATTIP